MKTITMWIENKVKTGKYNKWMYPEDYLFSKLPGKMKLSDMKEIDQDLVWSIKMFSDEGWKTIHKRVKSNSDSDADSLANGFIEFLNVWLEDNGFYIEIESPEKDKRKCEIFLDTEADIYRYYYGDLYQDLLTRYSEYLLGD